MTSETKITKIEQATRFDREMKPVEVYVLKFMVGESGPFTIEVSAENYTSNIGISAVELKARELKATLGI